MRSEFSSHFQAYRGASWTLPTGTNVDDVIFRYTLTLGVESALHSFVLVQSRWIEDKFDEKDQEHLRESLESESQSSEPSWSDWMGQELKRFAQTPDGLQDLLSKGWRHLQSTTEASIDQAQLNDFRMRLHLTMLTLSTLYRKFDNKLPETQSESWYTNKLWSPLFDLLDSESDWLRLDTGEITSDASSLRKNRDRDLETRHAPGRKIDGIIVCKKSRHELGAIEAGKTDEGASGTKVLKDGRKIAKLLKDMFDNICTTCPRSTDIRKRLRVYGLLVSGPRLEFVSLRYVDGRYYHLKSMKTMTVPALWDESGILAMLILVKEMLLFKTRLEETAKMIFNATRPVVEELLGNSSASIPPPTHPLTLTTPTSSPRHRAYRPFF
ncbi:MAG: hypothetical protein J3Q66DRAFT_322262 [Benniella sp.]|nr:MAG: hypothetical protein J3Q66DRAFT_322262 [Benniella sp.]